MGMDRKLEKSSPNYKKAGIIIIVLCIVSGSYLGWGGANGTKFTLSGERISVSTARRAVFEDYIPVRASVEPLTTVYLDAIEGGRVEHVLVEEGEMVSEGQAIIELSNVALQLDVISRQAQIIEQTNNVHNTKLAIEQNRLSLKRDLIEIDYQIVRLENMTERHSKIADYIDRQALDTALEELAYYRNLREVTKESQRQEEKMRLAQIKQLESSVVQLEQSLKIAHSNHENLLIKAPRAGRLTSLNAQLGESKSPGERLGQIDDTQLFKASGNINEFYLNRIAIGQRAEATIDGEKYLLELTKIYPEVNNSQFRVDLSFIELQPQKVRRGQSLSLRLMLSEKSETLVIDNGPFLNETGGAWAFALSDNGSIARKRNIRLGRRNPSFIEVEDGLFEGESVIVSSYGNFKQIDTLKIEE